MKNKLFLFIIVLLVSFTSYEANALRIAVNRIIFEGPKRADVLTVINNTDQPKTYRVEWRDMYMTDSQSLKPLRRTDAVPPNLKFSKDMIVFAPRRFTIPPKSSQQIRIMLRTPADLLDGEYRSHLAISEEKGAEKKSTPQNSGGVSMTMIPSVSIPVFVRKGNLTVEVSITDVKTKLTNDKVIINYVISRQGNKSVYGNVDFICNPGSSGEYLLRTLKGVAVYTEVNQRQQKYSFPKIEGQPECKSVNISYYSEDKGKIEKLAETTVNLN